MIKIIVGPIENLTSLLAVLRHNGVSATMRRAIKHNGICYINGSEASWKDFVHEGDEIIVKLPKKNDFEPQEIPIEIPYEDEYLLVVDKPAGLLMHPTSGAYDGTLANAVANYYWKTNQDCAFHPIHRLDRNTSGLVLLAKQPQIQYAFARKHLPYSKVYFALVTGTFPYKKISVEKSIARCPDSIIMRQISENGQSARTDYELKAAGSDFSLVACYLHTGRTHQIRVHSSYLGFPLLGDDIYGGTRELITRQALHAGFISFIHPVLDKRIIVTSPMPADIGELITRENWEDLFAKYIGGMSYAISNNSGNV